VTRASFLGLFAGLALLVGACTGVRVRDTALPPGMAMAFASVEPQVRAGAAASNLTPEHVAAIDADLVTIREALDAGNRAALLPIDWPQLRSLAEAGIMARAQSGEIPLCVAQSHLERLRLFSESWTEALAR
jgi:hypothetical protein